MSVGLCAFVITGCGPIATVVMPVRTAPMPLDQVEAAMDDLGSAITPQLFYPGASLQLPWDTVVAGVALERWLAGELEGVLGLEDLRYQEARAVYICPGGAVQIGQFTGDQLLPGVRAPVKGRWLAHWRRQGDSWGIDEAALGSSWLATIRLSVDADCVGAAEMERARRRTSASFHWGGAGMSRGGPGAGLTAELRYAGWTDPVHEATPAWRFGFGRGLTGSWGVRLLAGQTGESATAVSPDRGRVGLESTMRYGTLMAMHERMFVRLAAGPAIVRSEWLWRGPEAPPSSSQLVAGWVNEFALMVPLGARTWLDLAYHDWLFGESTPPPYMEANPAAQRLRGSSLTVGIGGRF